MSSLVEKTCKPCEGGVPPLTQNEVNHLLKSLEGWEVSPDKLAIRRAFTFKDFYQTMAFVNAIAWIANKENHHPDLEVGYNRCVVNYTTHAVSGLTENDFICAAKIEALLSHD